MMKLMASRLRREERGFTLIELMVVVLIIAILIGIAIPTFLGARKRAQDRAAQSSVRNTLTAAKTLFTDNESYTAATTTALKSSEPSLDFVDSTAESRGPNEVSINAVSANEFRAAAYSKSGMCFHIRDVAGPQTATGLGTTYGKEYVGTTTANCNASRPATNFQGGDWQPSW